ncbi:hypothetical protein CMQ_421 [Grosmannia clavigera kw1407]|uniref:Uncharacterized protein n=1 Tax=Grosmannia clavigera (strain kw1407 / UAMH 11150) TaxID=655863 RepID=F0XD56_GROCL|nr:uncharacterized protein CMQ_421 [Grosmannia clavigera kw1407]EFX03493.1 hypothetical protein CMQ_421 [Grosmannia clavigera kw1407]
MSKRVKDKTESGSQSSNSQPVRQQTHQPDGAFPTTSHPPTIPMFAVPPQHFYPQYPASISQIPMMPFPLGVGLSGGLHFPQHSATSGTAIRTSQTNAFKSSQGNAEGDAEENELSEAKTTAAEKTAEKVTADQFDHMKPFMINGQVMYPFPAAAFPQPVSSSSQSQYMPPGFIGHSGFPIAAFPNAMINPSMSHMFPATMSYHAFQGPTHLPPSTMNLTGAPQRVDATSRVPSSGSIRPPSAPPISSIRPSDISRKQIDLLRNSLKYHEDQLHYNKHQIDEKEMERTIDMLQSQIDKFESLNKSQLLFEELHYPRKDSRTDEASRQASQSSDKTYNTGASSRQVSSSTRRSDSGSQQPPNLSRRRNEACFSFDPVEHPVQFADPIKKSTLPTGAALAPPFEPRTAMSSGRDCVMNARNLGSNGPQYIYQQDSPTVNSRTAECRTSADQNNYSSSLPAEKQTKLGRPYLVGMLPAGMDVRSARGSDFVYERELNDDETRARYLYWGKAPQFIREGLPKFDGKDFYPPATTRDIPDDDGVCSVPGRSIPIGVPEVDYGFEAFPKNPESHHLLTPGFVVRSRKGVKVTLKRPKEENTDRSLRQDGCSKTVGANHCASDSKNVDGQAK